MSRRAHCKPAVKSGSSCAGVGGPLPAMAFAFPRGNLARQYRGIGVATVAIPAAWAMANLQLADGADRGPDHGRPLADAANPRRGSSGGCPSNSDRGAKGPLSLACAESNQARPTRSASAPSLMFQRHRLVVPHETQVLGAGGRQHVLVPGARLLDGALGLVVLARLRGTNGQLRSAGGVHAG